MAQFEKGQKVTFLTEDGKRNAAAVRLVHRDGTYSIQEADKNGNCWLPRRRVSADTLVA